MTPKFKKTPEQQKIIDNFIKKYKDKASKGSALVLIQNQLYAVSNYELKTIKKIQRILYIF